MLVSVDRTMDSRSQVSLFCVLCSIYRSEMLASEEVCNGGW